MSQYAYQPVAPERETNGLGIAGFVVSLAGLLFTGGLLSPVGLLISLIALGRRPRGFATAGVVLGLLGTCGWVIVFLFAGAAILAALGVAVVAVALTETEKLEITSDMANMAVSIKIYEEENRYLPASLDLLTLRPSTRIDPWGNKYEYHLTEDDPGFDIVSSGEDGVFGTDDDVTLTTLGEAWEAGGFNVTVSEQDQGGRVTITLGDRTITAAGDDDGGRVTVDLGDRVIEIVGDEDGGRVHLGSPDEGEPEAAAEEEPGDEIVHEEPGEEVVDEEPG